MSSCSLANLIPSTWVNHLKRNYSPTSFLPETIALFFLLNVSVCKPNRLDYGTSANGSAGLKPRSALRFRL